MIQDSSTRACGDDRWRNVCCSIQLSYRTREGVTRTRTGNPQITCSSSCIRRRRSVLATTIDERLLKPVRGDQSQDSNLLALVSACHVLPPAFASPIPFEGRQGNDRDVYRDRICSPGQHSASQQSHRRQFLTRFVPAKLLSANIDREAGVEPARNDVIPPAFATNLREGPTRFLVETRHV